MKKHPMYYDAQLIQVTTDPPCLVLTYQGRVLELPTLAGGTDWLAQFINSTGVARWDSPMACWRFDPYLDQSLRRVVEIDDGDEIGWSNAANPGGWTAPRAILPGAAGAFVAADTQEVRIAVPAEFFDLAERYGLSVEDLLRGFVADACRLDSPMDNPRADGYCSNGGDEEELAETYLERAYGQD